MPTPLIVAFWMLVSSVGFAAILVIIRILSEDLSVLVLNFWRNIFAVLIFVPWIVRNGLGSMRTRRLPLFVLRSVFMVTSSILLFFSTVLMPIGEVTAISFTSPLFATLLAGLMLKEVIGWRRALALAVGFGGVMLILRPGVEVISTGAVTALISSFLFAFVVILGKRLSATESPALAILYLNLLSLPVAAIPAAYDWAVPTGDQWLWLIALGIAANINMYGIQRAVTAGDASLTQVFDFIRLPIAVLAGWLAFREMPDPWMWAGAAIIAIAVIYTTRAEARRAARISPAA